jgi:hypothetical protein
VEESFGEMNWLEKFRAYDDQHNGWPMFFALLVVFVAGAVIFTRRTQ